MDKRRLMMTGVVAGSVGLGSLIGAIAFAPRIGLASDDGTDGPVLTICGGAADSLDAAAEAIGVQTSELLSALRDGRTISDVAADHDVPVSTVIDAVVAAEQDRLDALVADGRLTQERSDALSADLRERVTDLVNGDLAPFPLLEPGFGAGAIWPPGPLPRPGFIGDPAPWEFVDGPLSAAAEAIGVDAEDLLLAIREGRTIADVARAHGVAVSDVIDAIVSTMRAHLDAAVDDGLITQQEADRIAADFRDVATDLVDGDLTMFPRPNWVLPGGQSQVSSTPEPSVF